MRTIVVSSASALLLCALAQIDCAGGDRVPARAADPTPRAGGPTGVAKEQLPPVMGVQSSPPQPRVAAPTYGVTEAQGPMGPEQDERSRATEVVARASDQIELLHRIQSMSTDAYREKLDNAIDDLELRRDMVLQDTRELDAQPPAQGDAIRAILLQRDIAHLQASLRATYRFAPPDAQGRPPPAPLPSR